MAYVQTVRGRIDPSELGVTLPHEHTQCTLWHIENRWDYWQLTRDEPVILDELGRFRELGVHRVMELVRDSATSDEALERYAEDARAAGASLASA